MTHPLTPEGLAIVTFWKTGTGHLAINAAAGSGKTTILCELAKISRGSVLAVAFDTTARDVLRSRMPPHVEVRTLNSLGNEACRSGRGGVTFDLKKGRKIANALVNPLWKSVPDHKRRAISRKLRIPVGLIPYSMSYALSSAMDRVREMCPNSIAELDSALANTPYFEFIRAFRRVSLESSARALPLQFLQTTVQEYQRNGVIDHADQIYLPAKLGLHPRQYDVVLLDEGQDTSEGGRRLACDAARGGGRMAVVGDPHQAIYQFRGASVGAFQNLAQVLGATSLPLSVSFRCSTEVVAEARRVTSNAGIQAAPGAPMGDVARAGLDELFAVTGVTGGDWVVSHTNAPLVSMAALLARGGRSVRLLGDDLRSEARKLVTGKVTTVAALRKGLEEAGLRAAEELVSPTGAELEELWAQRRALERKIDLAEALLSLLRFHSDVDEFWAQVDEMYATADGPNVVTLSTIHKAKGSEADRVWYLEWSAQEHARASSARSPEDTEALLNARYVAITRAKTTFIYCGGQSASGKYAISPRSGAITKN